MAGPINWISQIGSITKFGLLSIPQRIGAVAATVIGIAGVVFVLVWVLSIAAGFKQAMTVSGSPDGAVVLRSGADSEMVSTTAALAASRRATPGAQRPGPAGVRGAVRHHQPAQTCYRLRRQRPVAWGGKRRVARSRQHEDNRRPDVRLGQERGHRRPRRRA